MELVFERGDRSAPTGHALVYFRSARDRDEIWATYVVVPPIVMDLAKYVPPMFASQLPLQEPSGAVAYPLPPLPEKVSSHSWLQALAQARGDDLLAAGQVDPSDLQRLMLAVSEVAQRYAALYADWATTAAAEPEAEPEPLAEPDVDELLYSVMTENEKVSKLARLVGRLRYAVEGTDPRARAEVVDEMQKLGHHLHANYRLEALITAAQQPGQLGSALAQLYVERAYKIATEDYRALSSIEDQIRSLEGAR